jgi:hypothetical protein
MSICTTLNGHEGADQRFLIVAVREPVAGCRF